METVCEGSAGWVRVAFWSRLTATEEKQRFVEAGIRGSEEARCVGNRGRV